MVRTAHKHIVRDYRIPGRWLPRVERMVGAYNLEPFAGYPWDSVCLNIFEWTITHVEPVSLWQWVKRDLAGNEPLYNVKLTFIVGGRGKGEWSDFNRLDRFLCTQTQKENQQ